MHDTDLDVRTAAVLAAGQTKIPSHHHRPPRLLDDKEPQVAFTAAITLWKMHDRSGEDILIAVVDGERSAIPGLVNGTEHTISRELHNPSTLARDRSHPGRIHAPRPLRLRHHRLRVHPQERRRLRPRPGHRSSSPRNAPHPSAPQLIAALADKDLGVRAAAAKALGTYHEPDVSAAIARLFDDPKPPVRLTAAAAYLISHRRRPTPAANARRPARPSAGKTARTAAMACSLHPAVQAS